ncbi:hypothetical protein [Microbacterium sp. Marseille-Q6965]|uniref:hypothetical protein n=1 Tax=Microbacterium sp. Marseille-Q6965 TaxID=2965072 RepID=UPI0021B7754B|nr:hypothetical protein [Microbacterium sp. Marseille-Q6965]
MTARHRIVLPRALPAAVLRVLLGIAVAGGGAALVPVLGWQLVAVAFGAVAAVFPATRVSYLGLPLIVLGMLITGPHPAQTALAVFVVHAIHTLTSIAALLPAGARVSLRALGPLAARFAVAQLVAQAAALTIAQLPVGGGMPWLAPVGALALAGIAVVFLIRGNRREPRSGRA